MTATQAVLQIDGHQLQVKRHARRTRLALRVRAQQVEVLAPPKVSLKLLEKFARQHQAWWLQALQTAPKPLQKLTAAAGESWPFLGAKLLLDFAPGLPQTQFEQKDAHYYLSCRLARPHNEDSRRRILLKWWYQYALDYLAERTQFFAQTLGHQPNQITIKSFRGRWGSCDARGRIQYNWKLLALPAWVVDYVVVHELCHLAHLNHSAAFWQLVEQHYPRTREAKTWLKQHGHIVINQLGTSNNPR